MEPSQYQYAHTKDLLVLDSRKSEVKLNDIPAELREVRTPLVVEEWEKSLCSHPDGILCLPVAGYGGRLQSGLPV